MDDNLECFFDTSGTSGVEPHWLSSSDVCRCQRSWRVSCTWPTTTTTTTSHLLATAALQLRVQWKSCQSQLGTKLTVSSTKTSYECDFEASSDESHHWWIYTKSSCSHLLSNSVQTCPRTSCLFRHKWLVIEHTVLAGYFFFSDWNNHLFEPGKTDGVDFKAGIWTFELLTWGSHLFLTNRKTVCFLTVSIFSFASLFFPLSPCTPAR